MAFTHFFFLKVGKFGFSSKEGITYFQYLVRVLFHCTLLLNV